MWSIFQQQGISWSMFFAQIRKFVMRYLLFLRWQTLLGILLFYIVSSWLLLFLSSETDIVDPSVFFYWLVVTASTVGYGDFSPGTLTGRLVTALYVIPLGLSLFALTVGRLAGLASFYWRRNIRGYGKMQGSNHILVIGWNGNQSLQLLKLLLREEADSASPREIVLCTVKDMENPLPGEIEFIKVDSFSHDDCMDRTKICAAQCIIINTDSDDAAMTAALYAQHRNPEAHMIAYLNDEALVSLLQKHCPNIECTPSVSVEMLAKSAVDPGSSYLHHELLNVDKGMTQYSVNYEGGKTTVASLFPHMKENFEATLIAVKEKNGSDIKINPCLSNEVTEGATLYYIADDRVVNFRWP
jgi:voltage-gated potassium channel